MNTIHPSLYISGHWIQGKGDTFASHNPATNAIVWQGQAATLDQIEQAIKSARDIFAEWSSLTLDQRSQYLNRYSEILQKEQDELAQIISQEMGKPLWESKTEVQIIINKINFSLEAYGQRCAGIMREIPAGKLMTRHRPHGVVAVFGPFNFPGHLPHGHIIPALLAGNTVVFKPSEYTPAVAEMMVRYWEKAQLPAGVINLVQGGPSVGHMLAENPHINGLFFTGSYKVGLALSELFGHHPEKILALEMGGNNPLVIGNIEDLETASYIIIQSAYLTTGQRCTCARRLVVPNNSQGDRLLETLQRFIKRIHIGPYTQIPEPFMGPVIHRGQAEYLLKVQQDFIKQGAKSLVEMRSLDPSTSFLTPGLIDVTSVIDRPDTELFGPLLQVIRTKDLNESIIEANRTSYGLVAGILSDQVEEYTIFYRSVRTGLINWNTPLTGASSAAPFGGVGKSGNYRPSAYYAADYCAYPVASIESPQIKKIEYLLPGLDNS